MLSAMFSQDPLIGVYKGMMPCANSQQTNAAVLCPARLSSTSSIRNGGSSASSVGLTVRPSCHRSQATRAAASAPPAPRRRREPLQDGGQLATQPGVEHRVGAGRHALQADPAVGRVEQREDLGRAVAEVLVRLARRLALGLPGRAGMGHRLERPGLVGAPDRQAHRLPQRGRRPRSTFFGPASGSVTTAAPALRRRRAVPVGHQVRVSWWL